MSEDRTLETSVGFVLLVIIGGTLSFWHHPAWFALCVAVSCVQSFLYYENAQNLKEVRALRDADRRLSRP